MDRPIDRIKIEGYKSIRKMDLEMGALNVLIGANGVGKSNFISAFGFLSDIISQDLSHVVAKGGGASRFLHFGPKRTKTVNIDLGFGINGYQCSISHANGDSMIWERERCTAQRRRVPSNEPYHRNLMTGRNHESGLPHAVRNGIRIAQYVSECMKGFKTYHFHDTSNSSPMRQTNFLNDNECLRPDGSNLAAILYLLREVYQHSYDLIVETIRQVAPFFQDFNLRPNPHSPDNILLQWKEVGSDAYFDVSTFSDGTLRFICLATLFLQPEELRPTTIIIDEPELGLHPSAIHLLATMLRQAAKTTQVIVATQSVTLVNQLQPEDVIVVDREDEQSTFQRLDTQDITDWLDNYGLGDLWEKNVFGGRP